MEISFESQVCDKIFTTVVVSQSQRQVSDNTLYGSIVDRLFECQSCDKVIYY